jgi:hypothetical protein
MYPEGKALPAAGGSISTAAMAALSIGPASSSSALSMSCMILSALVHHPAKWTPVGGQR